MAKRTARIRRIWLPSFFGRLTFLLFALSLLTLYFFIVGNLQGFADSTLLFLFSVESWTLALCSITGALSTIYYAASIALRNRLQIDRIVLSAAASAVSIILYLVMALLQAFMESYG
jgi:hypothetical protein